MAAFFVAWCFCFCVALGAVGEDGLHGFDDEGEDGGGDRDELDQGGDEDAVEELRMVDAEGEVAEVLFGGDGADDWHDEVGDKGVEDGGEGDAPHERDGAMVAAESRL